MEDLEQLAEKARKKELHRKSMIWTGAMIALSALAAGWIGFAPEGLVPRFGGKAKSEEVALKPMIVKWHDFSKGSELVLLLMTASWSKPCAVTDGTTFADPEVAAFLEKEVLAVRVDAEERPDLALRYLWRYPTVALLLPSGQIVDIGPYAYHPKPFLAWAKTLVEKSRQRRKDVEDAARKALASAGGDAALSLGPREALGRLRARLDDGQDRGGQFPRFDLLLALKGVSEPWAAKHLAEGLRSAAALEDTDGGGYFRDRPVKRLVDQADALAFADNPRLRAFVLKTGYAAGTNHDGTLDGRILCDEAGRMAAAVLNSAGATAEDKAAAKDVVNRFWKARGKDGLAPRRLGGKVSGLLGDQLGLIEGLLAAGRGADAQALGAAVEKALLDETGEAFYDRPARGEFAPALDRLRAPSLNLRAWRLWRALGSPKASKLEAWVRRRADGLDAVGLAELAR